MIAIDVADLVVIAGREHGIEPDDGGRQSA
jgi:hypothetical protein